MVSSSEAQIRNLTAIIKTFRPKTGNMTPCACQQLFKQLAKKIFRGLNTLIIILSTS